MYEATILADSVSKDGDRLTSVAVKYPHAVHKDMLRHRNQSRVVESFRARPTELLIEALRGGAAFRPDEFAQRIKGMGQGDALADQERANQLWDVHIEHCLRIAEEMGELDIAKQQRNFVLQDLCPLVEIVSATDWSNFFALRLDEDPDTGRPRARPEVFKTVQAIHEVIGASEPTPIREGEWHMPLVDNDEILAMREMGWADEAIAFVSAGRCARVSYDKHREPEDYEDSFMRAQRLRTSGHMSPFEQAATPFSEVELNARVELRDKARQMGLPPHVEAQIVAGLRYCGNFSGWRQVRKEIPNEHDYGQLMQAVAAA